MTKSAMVFKMDVGYHRKLTKAEYDQLRDLVIDPDRIEVKEQDDGMLRMEWGSQEITVFAEDVPAVEDLFAGSGNPVKIVGSVRSNAISRLLSDFGQRNTTIVNEKCSVAVAGLGLLTVDTVEVRTDYCTEALQRDLKDGWRILAICVQPDQRRPDYVLGRTDYQ